MKRYSGIFILISLVAISHSALSADNVASDIDRRTINSSLHQTTVTTQIESLSLEVAEFDNINLPPFLDSMKRKGAITANINGGSQQRNINEGQRPWKFDLSLSDSWLVEDDENTVDVRNAIQWRYKGRVYPATDQRNGRKEIRISLLDGIEYGSVIESDIEQSLSLRTETVIEVPYYADEQMVFAFSGPLPAFSPEQGTIPDEISENIATTTEYDFADPLIYSIRIFNKDGRLLGYLEVKRENPLLMRRLALSGLANDRNNEVREGDVVRIVILGRLDATRRGRTGSRGAKVPSVPLGSQIVLSFSGNF